MGFLRRYAFLVLVGCTVTACATELVNNKVEPEVWHKFERAEKVDLIVAFDDKAILADAELQKKAKGILFDDLEIQHMKLDQYASTKRKVISSLPVGQTEVLKNYDTMPLMFLRFGSAQALRALLDRPEVLRVYQDRQEQLNLSK